RPVNLCVIPSSTGSVSPCANVSLHLLPFDPFLDQLLEVTRELPPIVRRRVPVDLVEAVRRGDDRRAPRGARLERRARERLGEGERLTRVGEHLALAEEPHDVPVTHPP